MATINWRRGMTEIGISALAFFGLTAASPATESSPSPQTVMISASPGVTIEAIVEGRGKTIVMLPSWARGAADFDDMRVRLVRAGFRVVAPNPRGIDGSSGPLENWGMAEQADDVAAAIRATSASPVVLLGHAYGNRVARAVASRYPQLVCDLILVASGGKIAPAKDVLQAVSDGADPAVPRGERLRAIAKAHFAPGHDPSPWADGWHVEVGRAQQASVVKDEAATWWNAGKTPIFLIQPRKDAAAPPANAELLKREHPERVDLVYLEDSGHAAFPEQPEKLQQLIAKRMIDRGDCGS